MANIMQHPLTTNRTCNTRSYYKAPTLHRTSYSRRNYTSFINHKQQRQQDRLKDRKTERQKERKKERKTERKKDRKKERKKDRKKERKKERQKERKKEVNHGFPPRTFLKLLKSKI